MRGQHSLFANLLETPQITAPSTKGRNKDLAAARDTKLMYRYYYYIKLKGRQYAATLELLRYEFDITELRIIVCLNEKHAELKRVFAEALTIPELRSRYPFLTWK